ncbi:MAG: cyclic nucleotide-binding domain-containing protein [Bacteroidota bacterium]
MKNSLKHYMLSQLPSPPNEAEITEILALFQIKHFKKGEFFKKPFVAGDHLAFLKEGAVRVIIYKENGKEVTARIRQDNSFLLDPARLTGITQSPIGIECLEDLTLLLAPIEDVKALLDTSLTLNIVMRKHMTEQIVEVARNQYLFLTGTAKERYQYIRDNHPDLLKKFPLGFIASMIGITPTQLSRVRNQE